MTNAGNRSRLGALILLWLLTQSKDRTHRKLSAALKPLLEHRRSSAEQREAIDGKLDALEQAGLLKRINKSGLTLTEEGRRGALATLGLTELASRTKWGTVNKKHLVALSLGHSLPLPPAAAERLGKIEGLRAALIARHYNLKTSAVPTVSQVKDALAWRAPAVESDQRFSREAVLRLLSTQILDSARPQRSDNFIVQLAANVIGAHRSDARYIQLSVVRRWLDEEDHAPSPADTQPETPSRPALPPNAGLTDDKAFAARVLAAARAAKSGRFGDNKVFISHVFQHLKDEGAISEDLTAFKARLGAAHFRGLLSLSRADLVEAMAPEDVDASETQHEHATFHFVRI
jgi:hypothetical protein